MATTQKPIFPRTCQIGCLSKTSSVWQQRAAHVDHTVNVDRYHKWELVNIKLPAKTQTAMTHNWLNIYSGMINVDWSSTNKINMFRSRMLPVHINFILQSLYQLIILSLSISQSVVWLYICWLHAWLLICPSNNPGLYSFSIYKYR